MTTVAYRVARELFHKECVQPGDRALRVTILDHTTRCANCDQPLGDDPGDNDDDP